MSEITVIIPVYNTEKYIAKCLNSVLAQTYTDYDIVCVNDGSTDKSPSILNEFAELYKNISIVNQKNLGLSCARNAGLNLVSGKYVMFLDSDDFLPKYALEYFIEVANKTNADVIASEGMFNQYNFDDKYTREYNWKLYTNPLCEVIKNKKIYSSACNKLYKTEILKNIRFLEGIFFEDWVFITELFGKIKNFATIDIPLYVYNQSDFSIIRSKFTEHKIKSYMTGISHIYAVYKNMDNYIYAKQRYIIALKMCINKVYKNAKNDNELVPVLKKYVSDLIKNKIIKITDLPLITIIKLFKMKIISFKQIIGALYE